MDYRNTGGNYGMSGFGRGSGGGWGIGGRNPMDMMMDMMHQNGAIGFGRGGASVGGARGYGGGGGMGFGRGAVSG